MTQAIKDLEAKLAWLKRQNEAKKDAYRDGLPHLYGQKFYTWQRVFWESRNRISLLTAANQIGKSSILIKKNIHWATAKRLWPKLFPNTPTQFWYFYPDYKTATREFEHKWVPEFLPRGEYKNHPVYGWDCEYEKKLIQALRFNSGVTIYFFSYSQPVANLQAGTPEVISCDEELPMEYWGELRARIRGNRGYYKGVFTATRGQTYWKRAMEGKGDAEKLPHAHKQQISMYDCLVFEDGSPGRFTLDYIKSEEADCSSEAEVLRRIYGRFASEEGRKYHAFDSTRHFIKPYEIPQSWHRFAAVDIGTGGKAHPPAICFIAADEKYEKGVVYDGWLGDDGRDYTAGDIFEKFIHMRGDQSFVVQRFDQAAKDFGVIASRNSEPFLPSDKNHTRGELVVNSLFKKDMLHIFDTPELQKLGEQLESLNRDEKKKYAVDDYTDALRYGVVEIPWDFTKLLGADKKQKPVVKKMTEQDYINQEIKERRGMMEPAAGAPSWEELNEEIKFWNDQYG